MQILTAPCDEFRIAPNRTAAYGTFRVNVFGEIERFRVAWPLGFYNFHNGRNHFASFFDHHGVPDPNVFALNLVLVMQCRARDAAAAYRHRLKHRYGGENASAAHLHKHIEQAGLNAFRFVFVGDSPTRRFRREPKSFPLPV